MRKFLQRFTEPTTYIALGALGGIFGVKELATFGVPEVATTAASVAALLAGIFMREKGAPE